MDANPDQENHYRYGSGSETESNLFLCKNMYNFVNEHFKFDKFDSDYIPGNSVIEISKVL
jgi:hypothetical protein